MLLMPTGEDPHPELGFAGLEDLDQFDSGVNPDIDPEQLDEELWHRIDRQVDEAHLMLLGQEVNPQALERAIARGRDYLRAMIESHRSLVVSFPSGEHVK